MLDMCVQMGHYCSCVVFGQIIFDKGLCLLYIFSPMEHTLRDKNSALLIDQLTWNLPPGVFTLKRLGIVVVGLIDCVQFDWQSLHLIFPQRTFGLLS